MRALSWRLSRPRPSSCRLWTTAVRTLSLSSLQARQDVFEERSICPRIRHRLLGGCADLAALDHDRSVESGGVQRAEDAREVHFSRAELNHHVACEGPAILRAEAGDVLSNGFQFFNRVFAGVVDDVAGVIPD